MRGGKREVLIKEAYRDEYNVEEIRIKCLGFYGYVLVKL
jgi:hypothetical protein